MQVYLNHLLPKLMKVIAHERVPTTEPFAIVIKTFCLDTK
jgi:hypothetical protein